MRAMEIGHFGSVFAIKPMKMTRATIMVEIREIAGWKKAFTLPARNLFFMTSVVISSASSTTLSSIAKVLMVFAPSMLSANQPT